MNKFIAKLLSFFGRKPVDGKQKLINAAAYLVKSRSGTFHEDWFDNTQDFPSGHVISLEEADYYEALHILSCLATGRELCFYNKQMTQEWVDEAVTDYFDEYYPLPKQAYAVKIDL